MKLIVSEKPSVSRAISAILGATQKKNGYLEGNGYLVSWCVGHLVELAPAASYDESYAKWRKEDLPILPDPWQYKISEGTKQQFTILKQLMQDPRVESLICATDAGREGELIFRLVYLLAGCKKPVQRLWISSMEDSAIREGFERLKPASEYDALYQAALCRAQADWLVGINATRHFSLLYGQTLHIGRVMTPTLALLVEREAQIAAFRPTPFYHVALECGVMTAMSERLTDRAEAERIATLCNNREAHIVALKTREKAENPPKLYDLTALQRDANRLLGYTAQQTLDYAQALYEKRLATYPRTDSRYLTEDMEGSARKLAEITAKALPFAKGLSIVRDNRRIIDNGKVSDHHAILPTVSVQGADMDSLPAGERSVLTLLMARLLCAVGQPCRTLETNVALECESVRFTAKGRQSIEQGWKALEQALHSALGNRPEAKENEEEHLLPALNEKMTFLPVTASVREGKTTPPKRYTEATLLAAMETAGAEQMPDNTERKGLGTPATRAGIIEKLVKVGFIERKKSKQNVFLLPTGKGVSLITALPEEIQSPALTAEWEQKLKRVERGELAASGFMEEITGMVRELVATTHPVKDGYMLFADERKAIGVCPRCGAAVMENRKGFVCANRECRFALWKNDRFFTAKHKELTVEIAAVLLKEGHVHMKGLYSEKTGSAYDATIVLNDTGEQYVHFQLEFDPQALSKHGCCKK